MNTRIIQLREVPMPSARKPARLKRKNLILDQAKIDRARKILGAATETEAITRALDAGNDLEVFRREVDRGLDKLVGKGGFSDHFGPAAP
jgi:hypothetical protein